jgi:hypothetical protein
MRGDLRSACGLPDAGGKFYFSCVYRGKFGADCDSVVLAAESWAKPLRYPVTTRHVAAPPVKGRVEVELELLVLYYPCLELCHIYDIYECIASALDTHGKSCLGVGSLDN